VALKQLIADRRSRTISSTHRGNQQAERSWGETTIKKKDIVARQKETEDGIAREREREADDKKKNRDLEGKTDRANIIRLDISGIFTKGTRRNACSIS